MSSRRQVITMLGGAAATWPLTTHAQQPAVPLIGYMEGLSRDASAHLVAAFRQGLRQSGFIEDQNVMIEYRWADGRYDQLPALAADLAARPISVLCAMGGTASGLAARAATSTIPVVFQLGSDPVRIGLVESLHRPGGNVTGVTSAIAMLGAKRLDLLRDLAPADAAIAVLANPSNPNAIPEIGDVRDAARALGRQMRLLQAASEREIDTAFADVAKERAGALIVATDPFFTTRRHQIVALANHYVVPAIYYVREWVLAGGLLSYGPSFADAYRQVGEYAGRILKGAKPTELPVMQSTKFELFINLRTAKTHGFTIPTTLLALADEVIE